MCDDTMHLTNRPRIAILPDETALTLAISDGRSQVGDLRRGISGGGSQARARLIADLTNARASRARLNRLSTGGRVP